MKNCQTKKASSPRMICGMPVHQFVKLHNKRTPIHPDLIPCLHSDGDLLAVKHPLIIEIGLADGYFGYINHRYLQKKQALAKALRSENWNQYFLLVEKPYRLDALKAVSTRLTDIEYWEFLRDAYTDTEFPSQDDQLLKQLFAAKRPHRERMMSEDERSVLADLPDKITVYRGHSRRGVSGWSWTLDQSVAMWFANRCTMFGRKGIVSKGVVKKSHVIAYFDSRDEKEIVIDPRKVTVLP